MSFQQVRPDGFPPIVKNLIIINVLVYIAQLTLTNIGFTEKVMLYPLQHEKFSSYQIATHMFAHSPNMIFHIFFNMFALWMFGRVPENFWGGKRFLLFYLIFGVGAAICHLTMQYISWEQMEQAILAGDMVRAEKYSRSVGPALGASGAVMGIFAAFAYLFPNTKLFIMLIPIPIKAKWAILGLAAYDLFGGVTNIGSNIAHFAHLGGALTGFILVLIWNKTDRRRFY